MPSFAGRWRVVSSPDFDDKYMRMEVEPYLELHQTGTEVEGEYHVGLMSGSIAGRIRKNGLLVYSFEGMDEMEEVNGAGTATLEGDRLTFTLDYHHGDEWTFDCEREPE
jgi:hypothetical protein